MRFGLPSGTTTNVASVVLAGAGAVAGATVEQEALALVGWIGMATGLLILLANTTINGFTVLDWAKGEDHRTRLLRERDSFKKEIVDLRRLVGADRVITNKSFDRCILHHPKIKFQTQCKVYLSSMSNSRWEVLPEGTPVSGLVLFVDCTFDKCLFDRSVFLGTPADYQEIAPHIDEIGIRAWKKRTWEE